MKTMVTALLALAAMVNGCEWSQQPAMTELGAPEAKMVQTINDAAVRDGILRQSTIFPYHFEQGTAELNGLGQSTVAVLAERFRKNPGTVSVRRGDASVELHRQRIQRVAAALEKAGVPRATMRLADLPSSGDGLPGEQVLTILRTSPAPAPAFAPAAGSTSASTSDTGGSK